MLETVEVDGKNILALKDARAQTHSPKMIRINMKDFLQSSQL